MFGIGFPELVVICIVALLVLGPERLPEVARGVARWVVEIRRAADELKKELGAEEIQKGREEIERVKQNLLREVYVPPEPEELRPVPTKEQAPEAKAPASEAGETAQHTPENTAQEVSKKEDAS